MVVIENIVSPRPQNCFDITISGGFRVKMREFERSEDRLMKLIIISAIRMIHFFAVYAPQAGRSDAEKSPFWPVFAFLDLKKSFDHLRNKLSWYALPLFLIPESSRAGLNSSTVTRRVENHPISVLVLSRHATPKRMCCLNTSLCFCREHDHTRHPTSSTLDSALCK